MAKRVFDIILSSIGILLLLPFLCLLSLWIVWDNGFPIFYTQIRIGKLGKEFKLIKFRSMRKDAEKTGQLTIGDRDPRVTNSGYYLRKYKLDELPQLWNVLCGNMSLVGPRPEVPKYVALYTKEQFNVLSVKPGITDYASLQYFKESELLSNTSDPEKIYIEEIMPAKLKLNQDYVKESGLLTDIKIIALTLKRIMKS